MQIDLLSNVSYLPRAPSLSHPGNEQYDTVAEARPNMRGAIEPEGAMHEGSKGAALMLVVCCICQAALRLPYLFEHSFGWLGDARRAYAVIRQD